jgi:hypothetical protein
MEAPVYPLFYPKIPGVQGQILPPQGYAEEQAEPKTGKKYFFHTFIIGLNGAYLSR